MSSWSGPTSRTSASSARGARLTRALRGLLALALLFAAGACGGTADSVGRATPSSTATSSPTGAPTSTPTATPATPRTPTATPTPTPTKRPFLWVLAANGSSNFAEVKGAPAGSVCSAKAFLKSGAGAREIPGSALKPLPVTNPSTGVSWSGQLLPSPGPSPNQEAFWQITCTNNALNPPTAPSPLPTIGFQTP